ncbi:hypothetical protein HMPREF3200_00298 [Anaerococcus tetradius]|uniref:Uncharacterized protein n=1 Tax=Anaerococcus tetradius TaxID=33036 RepID=A0A133KIG3_9FIRM|nr:hypothetical protein HMPREF3200_00298 [Anaerococcus tetradius]
MAIESFKEFPINFFILNTPIILAKVKFGPMKKASLKTKIKGINIKIITLKLNSDGTIKDFIFFSKSHPSHKKELLQANFL